MKSPYPKLFGNGIFVFNKFFRMIPPIKPPRLLNANPMPKNLPLSDLLVVLSRKSAQIGTIIPTDNEYKIKKKKYIFHALGLVPR